MTCPATNRMKKVFKVYTVSSGHFACEIDSYQDLGAYTENFDYLQEVKKFDTQIEAEEYLQNADLYGEYVILPIFIKS